MKHLTYLILLSISLLSACGNRDELYANPPAELKAQLEYLLPKATAFVEEQQQIALQQGEALNQQQLAIASQLGIQHADKVRVYWVNKLPFPTDAELAQVAKQYGYNSPLMGAYTYGYGIWMLNSERNNQELLAHELVHVRQAEQLGLSTQIQQYLLQLFVYGYQDAPLELEAYQQAAAFAQ